MHVVVCCFIENLVGWTCLDKIKQTVAREMELTQNSIHLKRGNLGYILKAFGLGCTLMVWEERKQRLRAKTWPGR